MAFSACAFALIGARIFGGHLPDRFGGARVVVFALVLQALGLALISVAPSPMMAVGGAVVAGAGFSLVFPSLGLEAVRRVTANRGIAMGIYNAFLAGQKGAGFHRKCSGVTVGR